MFKKKLYLNTYFRALLIIWQSHKLLFYTNFLLQIFSATLPLLNLYIIKGLIDIILKPNREGYQDIIVQIGMLLAVQLLNAALNQLFQHLQSLQQQKITDYVAVLVIEKAISVPYEHYENSEYYDSLHLAQYQALYKLPGLVNSLNQLFQQGLNILLLSLLFVAIQWYYFFLFILIGLPLAFVKWFYSNKTNALQRKNISLERQSAYLNMVLTSLEYAKEVRLFGYGNPFLKNFKNQRQKLTEEKTSISYQNALAGFWAQLIEIIAVCYIYFKIAVQTLAGQLSIGSFVMYFQAFQRLQTSLKSFLQSAVELFQLRVFLSDLFLFLDIPAAEKETVRPETLAFTGIEVSNLSFNYPGSHQAAIRGITLTCSPGKIIAIVGENGSGKSTLVKLLTGLYPIQTGSIKINGVDINRIGEEELKKKITSIQQDFNRYEATVRENIAPGEMITADNNIRASAEAAGADTFIKNLSSGYDTLLGRIFNRSEQVSGGQWQKLALARALNRVHDIIILDEPTSHIDPIAEFEIFDNLIKNTAHKSVILITHRLYNLKKADHIYLMHEGTIAEEGNFNELIAKEGLFKEMYEKQKF